MPPVSHGILTAASTPIEGTIPQQEEQHQEQDEEEDHWEERSDWMNHLEDWFVTLLVWVNQPLIWLGRSYFRFLGHFVRWGVQAWTGAIIADEDDEAYPDHASTESGTVVSLPIQHLEIPLQLPVVRAPPTPRPTALIDLDALDPVEEEADQACTFEPEPPVQVPSRPGEFGPVVGETAVGGEVLNIQDMPRYGTAPDMPIVPIYSTDNNSMDNESTSLTSSKRIMGQIEAANAEEERLFYDDLLASSEVRLGTFTEKDVAADKPHKRKKSKKRKKKRRRYDSYLYDSSIPREIVYKRSTDEDDERDMTEEQYHGYYDEDSSLEEFIRKNRSRKRKRKRRRKEKRKQHSALSDVDSPPKEKKPSRKRKSKSQGKREDEEEVEEEQKKVEVLPTNKNKKFTELPNEMDDLPPSYTGRFHEIGFCEWGRSILPCLIVNPFDFEPSSSFLDSWLGMAKKHLKLHKRLDEGELKYFVYWFTDQTYSIVDQKKFIPWKHGKSAWKELPKYLKDKLEQDKSLTEYESIRLEGHDDCQEQVKKPPSRRTHPQMKVKTKFKRGKTKRVPVCAPTDLELGRHENNWIKKFRNYETFLQVSGGEKPTERTDPTLWNWLHWQKRSLKRFPDSPHWAWKLEMLDGIGIHLELPPGYSGGKETTPPPSSGRQGSKSNRKRPSKLEREEKWLSDEPPTKAFKPVPKRTSEKEQQQLWVTNFHKLQTFLEENDGQEPTQKTNPKLHTWLFYQQRALLRHPDSPNWDWKHELLCGIGINLHRPGSRNPAPSRAERAARASQPIEDEHPPVSRHSEEEQSHQKPRRDRATRTSSRIHDDPDSPVPDPMPSCEQAALIDNVEEYQTPDEKWLATFHILEAYVEENGVEEVTRRTAPGLHTWLFWQRRALNRHPDSPHWPWKLELLDGIGFHLERPESQNAVPQNADEEEQARQLWLSNFHTLEAFLKESDGQMPTKETQPVLRTWLFWQRRALKRHPNSPHWGWKLEMLTGIGINLDQTGGTGGKRAARGSKRIKKGWAELD